MPAVQGVWIDGLAFHWKDDVVGNHRGVQTKPLAFARQRQNALARRRGTSCREIEAEAHLSNSCGVRRSYSAASIRSSSSADRIGRPSMHRDGLPSTPTNGSPTSVIRYSWRSKS